MWTSYFVRSAGGWSLLPAFFSGVIGVLCRRAGAYVFAVIGTNAVTIYVPRHVIGFGAVDHTFVGNREKHAGAFGPVVAASVLPAADWLVLLYLYRRRQFHRV
jgi:hypothetical protein